MRSEIIEFEQLSDSREMLEAKEPNFIVIFIYLLLIIIIAAFTWMWYGKLDITVKANGVLRPSKNVSVVRNINGGKIEKLNYQAGQLVAQGDLLYVIESASFDLQLNNLLKEKERLEKEIANLKLLEKSFIQCRNLVDTSSNKIHSRYLVYESNYEQLELELNQAQKMYEREKSLPPASTTRVRLEELESNYQSARLAFERFKSERILEVRNELDTKNDRLRNIENQIEEVQSKKELYTVEAPISGTIQVIQEFNTGDYMPAGIEVLQIIPEDGEQYKVEIVVQNKDISQLKIEQELKYRFLALPYKEYGVLKGNIVKISEDAVSGKNSDQMVYRVEASINDTVLYDKAGKEARIKPGMVCEVRVVVRQKKILHYVLEKLNFLS